MKATHVLIPLLLVALIYQQDQAKRIETATSNDVKAILAMAKEAKGKSPTARAIPSFSSTSFSMTPISLTTATGETVEEGTIELDSVVETQVKAQTQALQSETDALKAQVQELQTQFKSAPPAPCGVETKYSQPEVKQYASPQTYAAGPVKYGNARYAGSKTITKTRKVAKTVYEEVPYQVAVPVKVRDVYQDVVEEVPVQRTKTVMRTEQRTRQKTVMVPKVVEETYSVNVPEQVTETVMTKRTKRVKVGTEEVNEPVQSYASAPSPGCNCVDCDCVDCDCVPQFQQSYETAYRTEIAPVVEYSAPRVEYAAPRYSNYDTSPIEYSSAPVRISPPRYSGPVRSVRNYSAPIRSYSTVKTYSAPQTYSGPVRSEKQAKAAPFKAGVQAFRSGRQVNNQQRAQAVQSAKYSRAPQKYSGGYGAAATSCQIINGVKVCQ